MFAGDGATSGIDVVLIWPHWPFIRSDAIQRILAGVSHHVSASDGNPCFKPLLFRSLPLGVALRFYPEAIAILAAVTVGTF